MIESDFAGTAMIVAAAENLVIGKDNKMPWHISDDLKRFKRLTMGKPIIMGRKTFLSIGKALPGRLNIVLSKELAASESKKTAFEKQYDTRMARNIDEAIKIAREAGADEIFFVGGAEIYKQVFGKVEKVFLTQVKGEWEGDTYLPDFDYPKYYKLEEQTGWQKDSKNPKTEYKYIDYSHN